MSRLAKCIGACEASNALIVSKVSLPVLRRALRDRNSPPPIIKKSSWRIAFLLGRLILLKRPAPSYGNWATPFVSLGFWESCELGIDL